MAEQQPSKLTKNEKVGEVVSTKMAKTIVVEVIRRVPHPLYKRIISKRRKFYAHDERARPRWRRGAHHRVPAAEQAEALDAGRSDAQGRAGGQTPAELIGIRTVAAGRRQDRQEEARSRRTGTQVGERHDRNADNSRGRR